jgi:hypothetical protein
MLILTKRLGVFHQEQQAAVATKPMRGLCQRPQSSLEGPPMLSGTSSSLFACCHCRQSSIPKQRKESPKLNTKGLLYGCPSAKRSARPVQTWAGRQQQEHQVAEYYFQKLLQTNAMDSLGADYPNKAASFLQNLVQR